MSNDKARLRILIVAWRLSLHTVRWVSYLRDTGWEVHLFAWTQPGTGQGAQLSPPLLKKLALELPESITLHETPEGTSEATQARRLARLIERLRPDLVHSLLIQGPGFLTLEAKRQVRGRFPRWMVSCWGNDVFLYGRLPEYRRAIRRIVAECDYYLAECRRDVALARALGHKGPIRLFPLFGGLDPVFCRQHWQGSPSTRTLILLKGYDQFRGRSLEVLRAMELCAPALKGYRVGIYNASPTVALAAERLHARTGIELELLPYVSHELQLKRMGAARLSIGNNISDGTSAALFDAMALGAFPIQSDTSDLRGWLVSGKNYLKVPPEKPEKIALAIERALGDDALVDRAASLNFEVVSARLNPAAYKEFVCGTYREAAST